MNEFVEECRREWERLGVPAPVSNDMAAELAADLEEAEAEGASAEEVLGRGAFDPREFATAWAAERGVIERPVPRGRRLPGRSVLPAAIVALALVAIIGALLPTLIPPSSSARLTLPLISPATASFVEVAALPPPPAATASFVEVVALPPPLSVTRVGVDGSVWVSEVEWNDSGVDTTRTIGSVLLAVALAGIVLAALSWWWLASDRRRRRGSRIDDGPSRHAY